MSAAAYVFMGAVVAVPLTLWVRAKLARIRDPRKTLAEIGIRMD